MVRLHAVRSWLLWRSDGGGAEGENKLKKHCKGSASSVNKISLGKYENSVCHVASTVAVKIDY
eukprot:COSAG01_NODE_8006_length_2956_cov_14.158558_1_plen_62_part_10